MEAHDWKGCPPAKGEPEVVHGEPVFGGTRMPVETAIENYYAFLVLEAMSEEEAINATLESFPTIPSPEALRTVLTYDAAHQHPLAP